MKDWLFRTLFPEKALALTYYSSRLENLRSELIRKFSSCTRSPLDESQWVNKFVTLDADYKTLEKEMAELRISNTYLKSLLRSFYESIE